jgi:hypothetical protein
MRNPLEPSGRGKVGPNPPSQYLELKGKDRAMNMKYMSPLQRQCNFGRFILSNRTVRYEETELVNRSEVIFGGRMSLRKEIQSKKLPAYL